MNSRSPDDADLSTTSDAIRASLEWQLRDVAAGGDLHTPPNIPDHTLLHRIGHGAYGDVWLARSALGALRAVKIVYRAHFDDDHPYEREFQGILNYEPISRTHEGLVQVLHVGRNDAAGCFYYVMEVADAAEVSDAKSRVKGESVAANPPMTPDAETTGAYRPRTLRSEIARHQRLPPVHAAQLAFRLAGALGHLHSRGLVHRDIKPSNVIFVGGQPKLADIGLVARAGDSRSFVGTEGFVPPEGPGTARADLYGLGKLLYELTTGRDRMEFPQLPSGVVRLPEGEAVLELNEVVTRACAPKPEHRYASAAEFQADLNLFLAGRSLRRVRNFERHVALLKRVAMVACGCLLLAAVLVWSALTAKRRADERAAAEAALRARAEAAEQDSRAQLYTALLGEARAVVRSGEMGQRQRALGALRRAAAITNSAELRREVFAALALPDVRFERELPIGPDVTLAELDPTFERLAVCRGRGPVEILAVSDGRKLATLPAATNLVSHFGLWSADGKYFAAKRDHDGSGRLAEWEVWELEVPRRVHWLHSVPWNAISFHPRLRQLLTASEGEVAVWDLVTGEELGHYHLAPERVTMLKYSPDGNRFAAVRGSTPNQTITVNDATDGAGMVTYAQAENLGDLSWHPDGEWLAVADYSGAVRLLHSRTNAVRTLGRHKAQAVRSVFSPDGRYLITGGWERELICWDMRTMAYSFTMGVDSYAPRFRADGRVLAAGTGLKLQVRLYAFERPTGLREFTEDLGIVQLPPAFSADGRWLAAMGQRRVGIWNLAAEGPGNLGEPAGPGRIFFTPDGAELFASIREDDCARWRVIPSTNPAAAPELQPVSLRKPDGFNSLCLASNQLVWNTTNGTRITEFDGLDPNHSPWSPTAVGMNWVSADTRWLGVYRSFGTVLSLYRWPDLELSARLTNRGSIRSFAFSPLGGEVAVASPLRVEFWDTSTWHRTRELTNFMDILYAKDGSAFWLTRDFRNAGLFDAATLEELLPLPVGSLPLALSPDGRHLAVSVDLRRLQLWDLAELRGQLRELGLDWAPLGTQ